MNRSQHRLFCDRSLGRHKVPGRLRQVHGDVVAHDDLFAQDADDEMWLRAAGRGGWIVLTSDDRIRYRPGEQRAVIESGVRCFCLHPTKGLTGEDIAEVFIKALPKILEISAREPGGYIKGVNRKGQVRQLFPKR